MKIKPTNKYFKMPTKAHATDAGFDCYAAESAIIPEHGSAVVSLGFSAEVPLGYYAAVVPRSGLAAKYGITVLNTPGTIDSGYRGEWKCIIINHGTAPFGISIGDRICQFIVLKYEDVQLERADKFSISARGKGGLGSTGR